MNDQHTPEISVIMPAYNEGGSLYENICETREVLRGAGHDAEIVVVDDGSTDDTAAVIARAAEAFDNVRAARNPYNMGKGMALRTGFDHSCGETIVFLDADLDLHPSQINSLLKKLAEGTADVVVTSKHHPESELAYPFARKIASLGYYAIIKMLFGLPVRDTQTGLKLFRREVLDRVFHRLLVKTYAYDVELLAAAIRFGYRVTEIPVRLEYRRELTWGRIRAGDVLRIFADTLAVFYRLRILKYYDYERPQTGNHHGPVLVVTRGVPPSASVIQRLSLDTDTRIASIGADTIQQEHPSFSDMQALREWLCGAGADITFVGMLGPGCTPLGSWVKNALRNFTDCRVAAVCGPVVPGPMASIGRKVSAMLYASVLSAGPDHYLRSITRSREVTRGLLDSLFIRADYLRVSGTGADGIEISDRMVYADSGGSHALSYDPDVAVSRPVPPLVMPYFRRVAREAFVRGRMLLDRRPGLSRVWTIAPFCWMAFLILGWLFLPYWVTGVALVGYAVAIAFTGLIYFEPLAFPVYAAGIVAEHIIRAVITPAGSIARLLAGPHRP